MPRPIGWKPLNYAQIATICGQLFLGRTPSQIAREMGLRRPTVNHFRKLLVSGGVPLQKHWRELPAETHNEIVRLIRTTTLTDRQITKRLGLNWNGSVRARRRAFHDDLRARGEAVPPCWCGKEFDHPNLCKFRRDTTPKPLDPQDLGDALKALVAGSSLLEMKERFSISVATAVRLLHALSPIQRRKRNMATHARRVATWRRNHRTSEDNGLFERLDRGLPKLLHAELRAEILQDMALRVLSGEVLEVQAIKSWQTFRSRAFKRLGDQWSNLSLDELREGGGSFIDLIEDKSALEQFDALDERELSD